MKDGGEGCVGVFISSCPQLHSTGQLTRHHSGCGGGGALYPGGQDGRMRVEGRMERRMKTMDCINLRKVYPRAGYVNNVCLLCLNYCWIKVR